LIREQPQVEPVLVDNQMSGLGRTLAFDASQPFAN